MEQPWAGSITNNDVDCEVLRHERQCLKQQSMGYTVLGIMAKEDFVCKNIYRYHISKKNENGDMTERIMFTMNKLCEEINLNGGVLILK